MKNAKAAMRVAEQVIEREQPHISPDVATAAMIVDTFVHGNTLPIPSMQIPFALPSSNEPIVYADQAIATPEISSMPMHDCTACAAVATCALLNFATSSERNPIKERIDAIREMTTANPNFFNQFNQGEREALIKEHIQAARLPVEPPVREITVLQNAVEQADRPNEMPSETYTSPVEMRLRQPESEVFLQEPTDSVAKPIELIAPQEIIAPQSAEVAVEIPPQTSPPGEPMTPRWIEPEVQRVQVARLPDTLPPPEPASPLHTLYIDAKETPPPKPIDTQPIDTLPIIAHARKSLHAVPAKKAATRIPEVRGDQHTIKKERYTPHDEIVIQQIPKEIARQGETVVKEIKHTVITPNTIHHLPKRMRIYTHKETVLPRLQESPPSATLPQQEIKGHQVESKSTAPQQKKKVEVFLENSVVVIPQTQNEKKFIKKKRASLESGPGSRVREPLKHMSKPKRGVSSVREEVHISEPIKKERIAKRSEVVANKKTEKKTYFRQERKQYVKEMIHYRPKEIVQELHILKPVLEIRETKSAIRKYLRATTPTRASETHIAIKSAEKIQKVVKPQKRKGASTTLSLQEKSKERYVIYRVKKKSLIKLTISLESVRTLLHSKHSIVDATKKISDEEENGVTPEELRIDDASHKQVHDDQLILWYCILIIKCVPLVIF